MGVSKEVDFAKGLAHVTLPGTAGDRTDRIPSMSEDHRSQWSGLLTIYLMSL